MELSLQAAVFVVLAWWASTGLILRLVWSQPKFHDGLVHLAAIALTFGFIVVHWSSSQSTVAGAFVAFSAALIIWGAHELTFLLGRVTGPRRSPCPDGAQGWARFRYGVEALIHHELALLATMVGLVVLTWSAENRFAAATFFILWTMRISAKLNVFLGVPNLADEFVPAHLAYLATYFRRARFNPLMPLSIIGGATAVAYLSVQGGPSWERVGYFLIATLLALAVLEHAFLALPLPDALLWRWILRHRDNDDPTSSARRPSAPSATRKTPLGKLVLPEGPADA